MDFCYTKTVLRKYTLSKPDKGRVVAFLDNYFIEINLLSLRLLFRLKLKYWYIMLLILTPNIYFQILSQTFSL